MQAPLNIMEHFITDIPWTRIVVYLVLSTLVLGNISTYLRKEYALKDGYSRKINHIGIMIITGPTLAFLPDAQLIPAVFIGSVGLIVIYSISALSSTWWVHGIVSGCLRKRDEPSSRFFFFFPLISFNITLVFMALLFPLDIVRIAFFTVAIADGLAEPIGLRYGVTNTYQLRDVIWKTTNTKSLAGSFTVMIFSAITFFVFVAFSYPISSLLMALAVSYGFFIATLEAVSPRGMDNMLILLIATPVAMTLTNLYATLNGGVI
ncbi:hypothetical protein Q5L94_10735 [Idiomarina sp. Sol25]|uniref:hypothetical protein n=1 Tax=Idiomarina sp. Sol25 TaxID=3064000 RepID=UPI00294B54C5|nr:hypothetical protein [Idiomarina sp. Sol25]MDV6328541.1 hypothetical protein [Idiomarina sp. Sol25]